MNAQVTPSAVEPLETNQTLQTIKISNSEFLNAVFGQMPGEARPVIVSFTGNPDEAPARNWRGSPWLCNQDFGVMTPVTAINYFTLSSFQPDEAAQYARGKRFFHALHAVMLDDVGTKVAQQRLQLQPSWILETSPGNRQVGYVLREPITDGALADRLMKAIIKAGLCEPGADGPCTRLARLPSGSNGKRTPAFHCRLETWEPALRYSADELVTGLGLMMNAAPARGQSMNRAGRQCALPTSATNPPSADITLAQLQQRGLYKAPLGDGRHDITCPWVAEHTDAIDRGTAYFEPSEQYPSGGFRCLHGHCAHRSLRDLSALLDLHGVGADVRPVIWVEPGELDSIVDQAERCLAESGQYYQRAATIVTMVTEPSTGATRVSAVSVPALTRALAASATWQRFDRRSDEWLPIDPPARYTSVLSDSASYKHLPPVNGVAHQPYLHSDGSLVSAPGYDKQTGIYGALSEPEFCIPIHPTREDAETALREFQVLLAEFQFKSESDLAAAVAAILTATVRASLPRAPMFHVHAHAAGTGKSYLSELIGVFATPLRRAPVTFPLDDEECRKLLLAELMLAPAVMEFDNLTSDLMSHPSLCAALSTEHMTGRLLGTSKTATVSTRTLFLSSGNNVMPVQDMCRRCITIRLDAACEVPAARSFQQPHLIGDLREKRGRYVAAALTIVLAWIAAGRPRTDSTPVAGFAEWCDLCREPLLWLGLKDPAASIFEAISDDPDGRTLHRLLSTWRQEFSTTAATVKEAIARARAAADEPSELGLIGPLPPLLHRPPHLCPRPPGERLLQSHQPRCLSSRQRRRVQRLPSLTKTMSSGCKLAMHLSPKTEST